MIITLTGADFSANNINSSIKRYKVTFTCKDSDGGTLSPTSNTRYYTEGSNITFGASNVPSISGYTFQSAVPASITSISADTTVTLTYVLSSGNGSTDSGDNEDGVTTVSFAEDSWDTIKAAVKAGTHSYAIGDTKTINLTNSTSATIRICDLTEGRYEYVDGSGSTNAVFEFVDCVGQKMYINNDSTGGRTNVGGYVKTLAPDYLTNTILPLLPSDLKNVLAEVQIPYCTGNGGTEMSTTTAKLFLASGYEITGDSTNNAGEKEGAQFQLHASNSSYRIKNYNSSATYWWTRTPNSVGTMDYYAINPSGELQSLGSLGNQGCVPFFAL